MTRKYKQATKRRNKTAVQKYRTVLNLWYSSTYKTPPNALPPPSLWQRITGWFKR